MGRRSPPVVNQTYETGCTWPMFRIFSFREGHSNRRLVSSRKHLNTHATAAGNGNSRSSSDVLSKVDEKYPYIGVSSRRRRDYSCKSISCVENDQVADGGNEVTKMIVDQRFVNKNDQGKDGAGCQPNQLLDALQILYSNKELFLKLLQDPNSMLVKQIHDLPSSQVKEPYQARLKRMTRLNKFQNSNARQCGKQFKSFDRYDLSSSCEPQSSNRIVVLKPGTINVKNFAYSFDCPRPHSPRSFSYNAQNIKPSHFPFGRIKRKLRYVMKVRRKEQQWRTTNGVPYKFTCGCQGFEDGKKVKEMESGGRNSLTNVRASIEKGLNTSFDLKKRHKTIKVKDSELCTGQEAASFGQSCSRNINNTSVSASEQHILNMHVEGRKSLFEMLNCGIEECKQCTNSVGRTIPLPDFESLPSLERYCEHGSLTEGMKYDNNYQMVLGKKLGLQEEGENDSYSSLGQKINDSPGAIVKAPSENLQLFGSDISIRKNLPGGNLHAHYDIPKDGGFKDIPTQNFYINNAAGGVGSLLDSHPEIQILSFSPEVAPSSPSPSHRIEDNVNMRNRVEHPSTESVVKQFTGEDVTNSTITIFKPDESPVQVVHAKFEENHFAELIRSSLDPINNLTSSKDILDYVREILQAFSLKWVELLMKCESSEQMLDPSTFDELKGLTGQLSGYRILLDFVIETLREVYQNFCFPPHISTKSPNVQAHVVNKVLVKEIKELITLHFLPHPSLITLEQLVEKDLARRGSWLNIQVDTEDIAMEVEEDILEKLVLEIVSEMNIRSMIRCNEAMCTLLGG